MSLYPLLFKNFLDRKGLRYKENSNGVISVIYDTENAKAVEILIGFDENANGVTFLCPSIGKFPKEQFGKLLLTCNSLNNKYRWMKFYVTYDNYVKVSSDAVLDDQTCGDECFEYVQRMVRIIDEVYPEFMKIRWS